MGAILAKFRRSQSTREILEKIQSDLDSIEDFKRTTQASHKKVIGYLLTYFSVLYLFAALVAYFKFFYDPGWQDLKSQLQLLSPFLIAPLLFMIVKNSLTWWYQRKMRRNDLKLEKLKKEKATLLETVMETETYKVAKEILEKFGLEHPASSKHPANATIMGSPNANNRFPSPMSSRSMMAVGNNELRRRNVPPNTALNATTSGAPASPAHAARGGAGLRPTAASAANLNTTTATAGGSEVSLLGGGDGDQNKSMSLQQRQHQMQQGPMQRRPPGPPLPRPLLPRERGYMDRLVEYLVGDGPANRYALICRQCQSHNGMALKEEFEYIAYRCCYCFYWNPARKQRPVAPKLTSQLQQQQQQTSSESTSEDEQDEGSRQRSASASSSNVADVVAEASAAAQAASGEPSSTKPETEDEEVELAASSEETAMETSASDIISSKENEEKSE